MKNILLSLSILVLLVFNLLQIKENKTITANYKSNLSKEKIKSNDSFKKLINDQYIDISSHHVTNGAGLAYSLNEIVTESKLILRVSEFNCGSCVDTTFLMLEQFKPYLKDKLIIVASISNKRDRKIFKRVHKLDYPIYYIGEGVIPLKAEKSASPYFFITDSMLKTNMVFVPNKANKPLTKFYLQKVIHLLNTK